MNIMITEMLTLKVSSTIRIPNTHWLSWVFILASLLFSCKDRDNPGILMVDVPARLEKNKTLSDLADSIKLIELETRSNSLITSISELAVTGSNLIVSTIEGRILVFDLDGKFIRSLGKKGDGPGEHNYVSSIAVDESSGKIYIVSRGKMLVYSSEFDLIEEIRLDFHLDYFRPIGGAYWGISNEYGKAVENGYLNETNLLRLGQRMEPNDTLSLRKAFVEKKTASILGYKDYISRINETTFIYTPVTTNESILRDTLYQLSGLELTPFAKLIFEEPHTNEKGIKRYWIASIVNSKSYISAVYYNERNEIMNLIHDKANKESYNYKSGVLDQDKVPLLLRPIDPENDLFYFIKNHEFSSIKTEEKNPTIGIVRLK